MLENGTAKDVSQKEFVTGEMMEYRRLTYSANFFINCIIVHYIRFTYQYKMITTDHCKTNLSKTKLYEQYTAFTQQSKLIFINNYKGKIQEKQNEK